MAERVTWVGHSTVLAELGDARLLTDPLLRARVGPLRRQGPPPPAGARERLDAVLISHLHRDHADLPSLRALGAATPLVVPPGAGAFMRRRGFADVRELSPGESTTFGGATVTAVAADHPGARLGARNAQAVGFLLAGQRRAYFAGDTDLHPGMEALAGHGLDLALLPIWGWGPRIGPGHLDPERAARAAALLAPRIAVPIHWGTYYPLGLARLRPRPLVDPGRAFVERARALAPQVEARLLAPGEGLALA